MTKLSVTGTKWSSLLARTRALILYISIWIFDFGPERLPGPSRNGPLEWVWKRLARTIRYTDLKKTKRHFCSLVIFVLFNFQWMSSPEKNQRRPRTDQSELESMGEKLETLTNEGNLHVGSISILVFRAIIQRCWVNLRLLTNKFEENDRLCDLLGKSP